MKELNEDEVWGGVVGCLIICFFSTIMIFGYLCKRNSLAEMKYQWRVDSLKISKMQRIDSCKTFR
jgi:hypothetical protein